MRHRSVIVVASAPPWQVVPWVGLGALYLTTAKAVVGPEVALGAISLLLAIPIGVAKSSTACGINVMTDLAAVGRPPLTRLAGACIYALTATITAAVLGITLAGIGGIVGAGRLWPPVAVAVVVLGLMDWGIVRRAVPRIPWQVPLEWVQGKRSGPVVWGLLLGTGLTTYMPHPSYFGLLLVVTTLPIPLSAAVMAAYGAGRALPTIVAASQRHGQLLDVVRQNMWGLRLSGHLSAGAAAFVVGGALLASRLG